MFHTRRLMPAFVCATALVMCARASASASIESAEIALREELRVRHPAITRFEISPLTHGVELVAKASGVRVLMVGTRSAVRVEFEIGGRKRAQTIWFDVKGMQAAMAATRNLAPHSPLTATDGAPLELDVLVHRCTPMTRAEQLNGMRSVRLLRKGELLCEEYVEPRPAVARGEPVAVLYVSAAIELRSTGVAKHDALVGQRVAIRNSATNESFWAKVTADREVQVHEVR